MIAKPSIAARFLSGAILIPALLMSLLVLSPMSLSAQIVRDLKSRNSNINGDAAVESLKRNGSFASLEDAFRKTSGGRIGDADAPNLLPGGGYEQTLLAGSDSGAGDNLGYGIAISGDTAVIGSGGHDFGGFVDPGAAYVFVRVGSTWTQQAKLTASDPASYDYFGVTVAIAGDTIVVGSLYDDAPALDQGSAYVFTRSGTTWTEQAKLTASDGAANDRFGTSVSISGDTVVVGSSRDDIGANVDQGSAYIFTGSGSTWTEQTRLVASDGAGGDLFGTSVAISGDTVVVGAYFAQVGADSYEGSVYVFTGSGATWAEQAKLTAPDGSAGDGFGFSVDVSGDTAVVGSWYDNVGANADQGSAYVFTRSGATWSQQQKLTASDGAANDRFGNSVSISGETVVVGAPSDDEGANADQGSAYRFTRSGSTWTQQNKLVASDGTAGDSFGENIAVDGDTIMVGAVGDDVSSRANQGSARIFQTKILTSRLTGSGSSATGQFGSSVSVYGDTAVIGTPRDENAGQPTGSVHVFVRTGSVWNHQQKLTAADGAADDSFGYSVSIWGDTIAVGAIADDLGGTIDGGSVHVFVRAAGVWSLQQSLVADDAGPSNYFGSSVSIQNNRLAIGAYGFGSGSGAVYIFERSAGVWTEMTKLLASDGAISDALGYTVSLSGNTIVAGAPFKNAERGAAYVFSGSGASWNQDAILEAVGGNSVDHFGGRVSIEEDTIALGAPDATVGGIQFQGFVLVFQRTAGLWNLEQRIDSPENQSGFFGVPSVSGDTLVITAPGLNANGEGFVYTRSGGTWTLQRKLEAPDGATGDYFGFNIQLSGETLVVGAHLKNFTEGAAYIYDWSSVTPTAGGSNFSGRILDMNGRGLANATVVLTDFSGVERTVQTGSFGRFSFANLPSGESYIIDVRSKRFQFSPQVVNLASDLDAFTMSASGRRR